LQIDTKVEAEFLAAIVQGVDVVKDEALTVVEPEWFNVDAYQWFVRLLKSRKWRRIAYEYLDQELLGVADDDTRSRYKEQLSQLYNRTLTFEADAAEKFTAYIAYCVANSTIRQAFESFGRSSRIDLLLREVREGVSKADNVIQGKQFQVVDYAEDYEGRQQRRKLERDNPSINPRILTGIRGLDQQFIFKAPMIVDFLAPFKRYKSIVLNAMSYAALLQGFNVAHIVYENSMELTTDRFDAMFMGMNFDRVRNYLITRDEKASMDRLFSWLGSWNNRLKIIKCQPKQTTVPMIADELHRLQDKTGEGFDLINVDYLNLVAPTKNFREERLNQGQAVWDLKNLADSESALIIEASQANMGGATADRLGFEHRGKSIDISQGIDISIAIDQNEKEREEGLIVLSPTFCRWSQITIPEIVLDSDISRMVIDRDLHSLWDHALRTHPV
jgi:hypothetical protein